MNYHKEVRRVNLYVTSKCNYDCSYCVIHDNTLQHPDFDYDGWRTLIDDYKEYPDEIIEIHIYGGEPLLHPDMYNIIRFFNSLNNVEVIVLTNGFFLKDVPDDIICNYIVSFHSSETSLKDFLKNIKPQLENINSISYMYDGKISIEESIKTLKYLKVFTKTEVVYWPAINPYSNEFGHSESINKMTDEIEQILIEDDQNFFRLNPNNTSIYHVWKKLGFFIYKDKVNDFFDEDIHTCTYMGRDIIEVYNNRIFRCAADLHMNIGIHNLDKVPYITEYPSFIKKLKEQKFSCYQERCISFDYNYMTGYIK